MCADSSSSEIGILILAAGKGVRYRESGGSGHKLLASYADHMGNACPLIELTLRNALQTRLPVVMVCRPDAAGIQSIAAKYQVQSIELASEGSGETIAAGVNATVNWNGWLILPGDMGWVAAEDIMQVKAALQNGALQARLCWQNRPGHPVGFSKSYQLKLTQLEGDSGARCLLNPDILLSLPASERVTRDADYVNQKTTAIAVNIATRT